MRPSWDEWGLYLAKAVSMRAACTRSQVGAVILGADNTGVSFGYNGVAAGELNCSDGGCPRGKLTYDQLPPLGDYSNCNGRHAEENAIRYADPERCKGATIYVTRKPCQNCQTIITTSGIARTVFPCPEVDVYEEITTVMKWRTKVD